MHVMVVIMKDLNRTRNMCRLQVRPASSRRVMKILVIGFVNRSRQTARQVLSDKCEPVSAGTATLPFVPRHVGATQPERRWG